MDLVYLSTGEIAYWDAFGNLISNIPSAALAPWGDGNRLQVRIGDQCITGIARHYAAVPVGSLVALVSSAGFLEVARRDGNAAEFLGIGPGATLSVTPRDSG